VCYLVEQRNIPGQDSKVFFERFLIKKNSKKISANKRKIYFIIANNWGTYIMCGYQFSNQLKVMGIESEVINIYQEPERIKAIKDSVVVFIKETPIDHHKIIHKLKKQRNILIWSPYDGFSIVKDEQGVKMFDGALVPNKLCKRDWSSYFSKNCLCDVLYLHWDPRCVFNRAKEYRLVYAGIILPGNISEAHLKNIKGLHTIEINTTDLTKQAEIFEKIVDYSCHFSVREENSDHFKYKPNAKLSFAAGTNSNTVLSRDQSSIELLDEAYPYYTNSGMKDVIKTVDYSRDTYGSKVWNDALEMMRDIRERTSIERICNDFLEYLGKF